MCRCSLEWEDSTAHFFDAICGENVAKLFGKCRVLAKCCLELCILASRDDTVTIEVHNLQSETSSCPLNALFVADCCVECLDNGKIVSLIDAWHEIAIVAIFEAHFNQHENIAS